MKKRIAALALGLLLLPRGGRAVGVGPLGGTLPSLGRPRRGGPEGGGTLGGPLALIPALGGPGRRGLAALLLADAVIVLLDPVRGDAHPAQIQKQQDHPHGPKEHEPQHDGPPRDIGFLFIGHTAPPAGMNEIRTNPYSNYYTTIPAECKEKTTAERNRKVLGCNRSVIDF